MILINAAQPLDKFEQEYNSKYNHDEMRGKRLRNANGDISQGSLGMQYTIDTLTFIRKKTVQQKFYEIEFGNYVPVSVSEAAFFQNVTTNLVMNSFGDFTQGDLNEGTYNARLATADVGITPVTQIIKNWGVGTGYTIIEIEQALMSGNWDVIASRQKSRKMMWDLGLQRVAFLGHPTDPRIVGLLNNSGINVSTTVVPVSISAMSSAQFATFVATLLAAYLANNNNTALPTHFAIPLSDYVGLATPVASGFPFNSKLEYLQNAFKAIVKGGVEIYPLAYCDSTYNAGVTGIDGVDRYVLYRNDEDSLLMQIPVDLTVTQAGTYNNFNFEDAGYGQYGGVQQFRSLETMYFDIP